MNSIPSFAVLAVFCAAAVIADIRTNKVPNALNAAGFAAGIITGFLEGGVKSLQDSLFGAVLGLGILLVPFLLKMVGAGDVKFLAAAGAITGWHTLSISFLAGAAFGIVPGVITAAYRYLKNKNTLYRLAALAAPGSLRIHSCEPIKKGGSGMRLPYAVPLSLGLIICSGLQLVS